MAVQVLIAESGVGAELRALRRAGCRRAGELRLEVVVEAEKFVAQVRRGGGRIEGWEARALIDGVS